MRYINPTSNRGLVNLLADFILSKLTLDYDSVIEVTDCGKFFVINGITNRKDYLDMPKIQEEFAEKHKELITKFGHDQINVIDLVMYDTQLEHKNEYWFTLHNTERPLYSKKLKEFVESTDLNLCSAQEMDNIYLELDYSENNTSNLNYFTYSPMTVTSEFPYGHSLNMGRLHMYYSEYIANHIFSTISSNKIEFKVSTKINQDEDFDIEVYSPNSPYPNKTIKSLILDVFNFDLTDFQFLFVNYDVSKDLTEPFEKKPWLVKDRIEDVIIF